MLKPSKNIQLKPYDPNNWPEVEQWYYSGEYEDFFRDIEIAPNEDYFKSLASINRGFSFSVFGKGGMIGLVLVYNIRPCIQSANISVLIDKKYHSTKIGAETFCTIAKHLFNDLNLRKLVIEIVEGREDLMRIAGINGMQPEAILVDEAKIDGQFKNVIRYAIFPDMAKKIISELERIGG